MLLKLASDLTAQAERSGVAPEALALEVLRRYLRTATPLVPIDDWERQLFALGVDCGVSVPDSAFDREELYD